MNIIEVYKFFDDSKLPPNKSPRTDEYVILFREEIIETRIDRYGRWIRE